MKKPFSEPQETRAHIANRLTLPLVVLESLKEGKKVSASLITKAVNELKDLVAYLDK